MWRTKKFPEKSLGGLIFKHMYDIFPRESESMHTPFSVTIFYFYICNLIGPFTYAKGERTGLVLRASDSGSGDPGSILGRVGVLFP